MPLIECPDCGHKVLSVASLCPHCGFSLSSYRKRGRVPCRKCGYEISVKQADCPHCGTSSPASKYPPWVGVAMAVAALVLLGAAAVWTQIDRFTTRSSPSDSVDVVGSGEALALDVPAQPTVTQAQIPEAGPALPPPRLDYVTQVRWSSTWVNVREGRGSGTPVVRTLQPGQRLEVDSLENGWWAVYLEGRFAGYVANTLLLEAPPNR